MGLVCVRGSAALVAVLLGLSVEWVFGALVLDYIVKASLLTMRFRSGRWKQVLIQR